MNRRTMLRNAGLFAAAGFAGCLADGSAGGSAPDDSSPTGTPTDTPRGPTGDSTPTPSPTPVAAPELVASAFEVVSKGPGDRSHEAAATVASGTADEDLAVEVTGTIPGANGCYVADLADAAVDGETLTVLVESFEAETKGTVACTQAIVAIDYRATFTFEGSLPDRVVVVHEALGERTTVGEIPLAETGDTPTGTDDA